MGSKAGFQRPSSSRRGVLNNNMMDEGQISAAAAAEHVIMEVSKNTNSFVQDIQSLANTESLTVFVCNTSIPRYRLGKQTNTEPYREY
jgi:hypothetical protein